MSETPKTFTLRVVLQMLLLVVAVPFLPLLISGHWNWWQAWIYALVCVLGFIVSRALARRRSPDLLAERSRFMHHENTQTWDKTLAPLVGLGGGLIPLAAGLEALLDGSVRFGPAVKIIGLLLFLAGYALGSYALIANRYFSGMVRLQTDRGHQVVSGGPYRWVRHPGYSGALLSYLASPLILDSLWALAPLALLAVVLVVRTALEDRFLQEQLEGYRSYAGRVRYRLFPGVW